MTSSLRVGQPAVIGRAHRVIVLSSALLLVAVSSLPASGDLPLNFKWVNTATDDAGNAYGYRLALDRATNVYITGEFFDSLDFGTTNLSGSNFTSFVASYTREGALRWATKAGGLAAAIAVDAGGNCYITGQSSPGTAFANHGVTNQGLSDVFVAKYGAHGDFQWVRTAGGPGFDGGTAIAADSAGNCYVTGYFGNPSGGTATFGTNELTSVGNGDVFLAKYDTHGQLIWLRQAGGGAFDLGAGVALDGHTNIFLTGRFTSFFLSKYNNDGDLQWTQQSTNSLGKAVAVDTWGNCYVGGDALDNAGFVGKYSPSGELLWSLTANGAATVNGVATDPWGHCYATGNFQGEATFGGQALHGTNMYNFLILQFGLDGAPHLIALAGGIGDGDLIGDSHDIAVDQGGTSYISGSWNGTATFGSISVQSQNNAAFVARLEAPPHLTITHTSGHVILSWPTNQSGFTLECATASGSELSWSLITNSPIITAGNNAVTNPASAHLQLYRLRSATN